MRYFIQLPIFWHDKGSVLNHNTFRIDIFNHKIIKFYLFFGSMKVELIEIFNYFFNLCCEMYCETKHFFMNLFMVTKFKADL